MARCSRLFSQGGALHVRSRFPSALDKRTIAVNLEVSGRHVHLIGVAAYQRMDELGHVLRIHVADPAGEFDLILREEGWKGEIVNVRRSGCDFQLAIAATDLVAQQH